MQSIFWLAARRPPADSGRARHRAADQKMDWTEPLPRRSAMGVALVGRHCWRAGRGSYVDVADRQRLVRMSTEALPQRSGGVGDASRPARRPGSCRMRRLADFDGLVTTNPGWPSPPTRRRGRRRGACSRRDTRDTAATSDRSTPRSGRDSRLWRVRRALPRVAGARAANAGTR